MPPPPDDHGFKRIELPVHTILGKLAAGSVAGVLGTCAVYPMDTLKTRVQASGNSVGATFRAMIKAEGARGFYRGLTANLAGIIPEKAIKLAVNDVARTIFANQQHCSLDTLPVAWGAAAGAIAGTMQCIATCPMEITKIQMQMAATQNQTLSLGTVVRSLGVRGLYRGSLATLSRDVPFSILFFPLQAAIKVELHRRSGLNPSAASFFGGLVAGCIAAAAVTPADRVKTMLQTKDGYARYGSITGAYAHIWRQEGPRGLFRGAGPRCAIVAPLFGIAQLAYEVQQRYFSAPSVQK